MSPHLGLQVHSLKLALEGVEKERDFYFGKLREIELLCQEQGQESDSLVQRLMEVLYASDEHVSGGGARWGSPDSGRTPRSQGPCGSQGDRQRVLRPRHVLWHSHPQAAWEEVGGCGVGESREILIEESRPVHAATSPVPVTRPSQAVLASPALTASQLEAARPGFVGLPRAVDAVLCAKCWAAGRTAGCGYSRHELLEVARPWV